MLATTASRALATTATLLIVAGLPAQAQDSAAAAPHRWEIVLPTGTLVPTGAQRQVLKRGAMNAAQVFYMARPNLAITATLGWTRSRDIATAGAPKVDVFNYDLGAELRAPRWIAGSASFRPFAGAGIGARSYNYRSLDVDATHNPAAYLGLGGELGYRRVRLRIEVRDYVTGFRPLAGAGSSAARNDVVVMAGLRLARKGS